MRKRKLNEVIRNVEKTMEENCDVEYSMKRAVLAWTDGRTDNIKKAAAYVRKHTPNQYKCFENFLVYVCKIS